MSRAVSSVRSLLAATLFFAILAGAMPAPVQAGTTHSFTLPAASYPASRERRYKVYVPEGLAAAAPLVMALHGCEQTNDDVLNDWGLVAAADRYGFVLVAPFITSYDGLRNTNCWGFWLDQHRHQGRGEVEDLHRVALDVESRFAIDPARRYITGLSSGGAMTAVAAVAHNEYWAAAATAAGLPYGEDAASVSLGGLCPGMATFHPVARVASDMRAELNDPYPIPLLVLQNDRDCVVVQPAGNNLRDAHLAVFGGSAASTPSATRSGEQACVPAFQNDFGCRQTFYIDDSSTRSLVETVFFTGPASTPNPGDKDLGHYWIGGENGNNGRFSIREGPSYPDIIWDFFARHARAAAAADRPVITLRGANPMQLTVGQTFTDPGASASDPQDGTLTVMSNCSNVDPSRAGSYSCTYTATDSAGNTTTATRSIIVSASPPPAACAKVSASPVAHIEAGRAVRGGLFNLRALASGNGADIGFGWDSWSLLTLYEGQPGKWFPSPPAGCPS